LLTLTGLGLALLVWSRGRLPFLWEADISIGPVWSSLPLSLGLLDVARWLGHGTFPPLTEHLSPSLAQVQLLRAQLESCRARNESLREAAKSQGDGHVPRGYISQVSGAPDAGSWGRFQSQTGKCWDWLIAEQVLLIIGLPW